jgi:hypothetical protein
MTWRLVLTVGMAFVLGGCAHVPVAPIVRSSGIVVDAQQHPVPGATVEIYRDTEKASPGAADREVRESTETDAQGVFYYQASESGALLVAHKPGFAMAWLFRSRRDELPLRLTLGPSSDIAGVVVGADGKPIADAQVWPLCAAECIALGEGRSDLHMLLGKPARELLSARTAADGTFRITGCPSGAMANLTATKAGLAMRQPPSERGRPEPMQCSAGQRDVKLVMEPGGDIRGRVIAKKSGEPLRGVSARLEQRARSYSLFTQTLMSNEPRESILSGPDGSFHFADIASGAYRVSVDIPGRAPTLPDLVAEPIDVTVGPGQQVKGVQVAAVEGGFLEVSVLGRTDGKPLAGAGVFTSGQGYMSSAAADRNGVALFRLLAGKYSFSVSKSLWSAESGTATVESGRTTHQRVELRPKPMAFVAGTVLAPSAAPASNVRVNTYSMGHDAEVRTDANGQFLLRWNPEEFEGQKTQTSLITARDWKRNEAAATLVDPTKTNVVVCLRPALTVAGQVKDEDGKPFAKAPVKLEFSSNWPDCYAPLTSDSYPFVTDAEGRFMFTALPQELRYDLLVRAEGYGEARYAVKPEEMKTNYLDLALVLKNANRILGGQAVDVLGKPLPGASVMVSGEGQPLHHSVKTDDSGHFEFDHLCAGQVKVFASFNGTIGSRDTAAQAGATNVIVTFDPVFRLPISPNN